MKEYMLINKDEYILKIFFNYATWLYTYLGDIIIKVTPIFNEFEKENYREQYSLFIGKYEDIFRQSVCLDEIENVKIIILPCPEFTAMGYWRNPQGRQ